MSALTYKHRTQSARNVAVTIQLLQQLK